VAKPTDPQNPVDTRPGERKKIGPIDGEPKSISSNLDGVLSPRQQALRKAVINNFTSKRVKSFVSKQVQYINSSRQVADGVRYLFDELGRPPSNAPLEDIVKERENIEANIRWFEAIIAEMENKLSKIKEIEVEALELMAKQQKED
jgi:hypothetical protein